MEPEKVPVQGDRNLHNGALFQVARLSSGGSEGSDSLPKLPRPWFLHSGLRNLTVDFKNLEHGCSEIYAVFLLSVVLGVGIRGRSYSNFLASAISHRVHGVGSFRGGSFVFPECWISCLTKISRTQKQALRKLHFCVRASCLSKDYTRQTLHCKSPAIIRTKKKTSRRTCLVVVVDDPVLNARHKDRE